MLNIKTPEIEIEHLANGQIYLIPKVIMEDNSICQPSYYFGRYFLSPQEPKFLVTNETLNEQLEFLKNIISEAIINWNKQKKQIDGLKIIKTEKIPVNIN